MMAQHFSQSKAYRNLSFKYFYCLTEDQAREKFTLLRWGSTTKMPCPRCNTVDSHYARRHRHQWRCRDCDAVFSVTTGTPFSNRKLSFQKILLFMLDFSTSPKGCSANQLHAKHQVTLRTAYITLSKLREALFEQRNQAPLSGIVQVDGGHFGGKPRRPRVRNKATSASVNSKLRSRKAAIVPHKRGSHIEPWNLDKFKNRRIVLVLRQLSEIKGQGAVRSIAVVVMAENLKNVYPVIRKYITPGSTLQTDEGKAYSWASMFYTHETVCHSREYSTPEGFNNNQAESYFGRFRRAEFGTHHGMRPQYLAFYANEFAWREDTRRLSLSEKFDELAKNVFLSGVSKAWCGYNQGHRLGFEYIEEA